LWAIRRRPPEPSPCRVCATLSHSFHFGIELANPPYATRSESKGHCRL
jgi:hypothetical protein